MEVSFMFNLQITKSMKKISLP